MDKMRIAVLGGGALGLTVAYRLARRGAQVTVIEKEGELGGLAAGFRPGEGSVYLEKFYHHLFRSDKEIQALIAELGLADKLLWLDQLTATLYHGKVYPTFRGTGDVLRFTPLSLLSRLRLGAASAYLK